MRYTIGSMFKIVSLPRSIQKDRDESAPPTRMSLRAVRLLIEDADCGYGILTESHRWRAEQ